MPLIPAEPDPHLAQLATRIEEIERELTEATSRATNAEEALEDYQTRTDKTIEQQQKEIEKLSHQKDKAKELITAAEKKITAFGRKETELIEGHQVTLRERKSAEDEARNEMVRYKDELKQVKEELEKEKAKALKNLAANEKKKLEEAHNAMRLAELEQHKMVVQDLEDEYEEKRQEYRAK